MTTIANIPGLANTSPAFQRKLVVVAGRLRMVPTDLAAVMGFESGLSFSPSKRNPVSGATGLIQFVESTAKRLGTTTAALAQMTAEAQLDYVERYLQPYAGRMGSLKDAYLAVFAPAFIGSSSDKVLYAAPSLAYEQNKGLDRAKKGAITVADAVAGPAGVLARAQGTLTVPDNASVLQPVLPPEEPVFFSSPLPPSPSPSLEAEPATVPPSPSPDAAPATVPPPPPVPTLGPARKLAWAITVDVVAIAVFGGLVALGKLDGATAGALIVAVCAGRLDPKALGGLPSGVGSILGALMRRRGAA